MTPRPQSNLHVATHEAGHAITGWLFGDGVRRVTIVPDHTEGYLGCYHPGGSLPCGGLAQLRKTVGTGAGHVMVQTGNGGWRLLTPGEKKLDALASEARLRFHENPSGRMIRCAAGEAAVRLWDPTFPHNLGVEDDRENLSETIGDGSLDIWEHAVTEAMEYLAHRDVWPFVLALAGELAVRKTMNTEGVLNVFRRVAATVIK